MKDKGEIETELRMLEQDLKHWEQRLSKEEQPSKRVIAGNMICGIQGRIEALDWVLED